MSSAIPSTLGCVTLVYVKVDPQLVGYGVLMSIAMLVALHLLTARSRRPLLMSSPLLAATTLAAMLDKLYPQLPSFGLTDTVELRVAALALLGMGAGIWVGLLYLLRAQHFSRYIPAPVYAGFGNAIALVLVISQVTALTRLLQQQSPAAVILSVALASLAAGFAAHRWRPRWPASAVALGVGAACGALWMLGGETSPAISSSGAGMPWQHLPSLPPAALLQQAGIDWVALARTLAGDSAILGSVLFINTTVCSRAMSNIDGRAPPTSRDNALLAVGIAFAGLLGSAPLAGSQQSNTVASRRAPIGTRMVLVSAAVLVLVYLSGVLALIPIAAVCGALLCEAWYLMDRRSLALARAWLAQHVPALVRDRRNRARAGIMNSNAKEDLALIAAVTLCAVAFNMVAAALTGLVLGLFIYAARNGDHPVRAVWTGAQISSNCARSRDELELLAGHASEIRVLQFEGDVFFGSVDAIEGVVRQNLDGCGWMLFDWSRVRHVDTSLARAIARLQQNAQGLGVQVLHGGVGTAHQEADVATVLAEHIAGGHFLPDTDRALEVAENLLIQRHAFLSGEHKSTDADVLALFNGLSDDERGLLERRMWHASYKAGDTIFKAGEESDTLLVVLRGTASIIVPLDDGHNTRLAGLRRGATIGEMGFFDRAPRSATVVAQEDVEIAVLTRGAYEDLSQQHPHLMQQLLSNVMLDLAARLRHTNRVAVARNTQA